MHFVVAPFKNDLHTFLDTLAHSLQLHGGELRIVYSGLDAENVFGQFGLVHIKLAKMTID